MTNTKTNLNMIRIWLAVSAGMVFLMAIIGAVTRLSEAGLSMVDWRPVLGWLPPMGPQAWQEIFQAYKQSPEFEKKHFWMSLSDFKKIYWLEWLHRLWGRLTGLVYGLPLLFFWWQNQLPAGHKRHFVLIAGLIAAQGVLGWYMVKSGLVDRPSVSHYRLAAHLGLAVIIYGLLIWRIMRLRTAPPVTDAPRAFIAHGWTGMAFLGVTIVWGAFVAGLDAGLIYNSFPDMGGALMPPELDSAGLRAWFDNRAGVQFLHRWLGIGTAILLLGLWLHGFVQDLRAPALDMVALLAVLQAGLGIATLLTQVWLPLATLHQAGALLILTCLLVVMADHRADARL